MRSQNEDINKKLPEDEFLASVANEEDAKVYEHIFRALHNEEQYTLKSDFADHVVKKIVERQSSRSMSREYFWFGAGIFSIVISFIIAVWKTEFKFSLGFLEGVSGYSGLFIFGVIFITLLHVIDKKIIRAGS